MHRISRWFKHRWADDSINALSASAPSRIHARISASELSHTGEIRVCVEAGLPNSYLFRKVTTSSLLRQRALALFGRLGIWDTEDNNGVLIYLCLAERAIELVADRGVNRKVDQLEWNDIVLQLAGAIRAGQFEAGLNAAIDEIHTILSLHYPAHPGQHNANELSDAPVML